MLSGGLLSRSGQLGYDIILRANEKISEDNEYNITKGYSILNQMSKNTYNNIILTQYNTVCFHIIEYLVPE